jgi:hypothetical protein
MEKQQSGLEELVTFKKGFANLQLVAMVSFAGSLLFSLVVYFHAQSKVNEIYTLAVNSITDKQWVVKEDGTALQLERVGKTESSQKAEFNHHLKMVYNSFYVFDPYINFDEKLSKGLDLVSKEIGTKIIDNHDANDLANLIKGQSLHLYIEIDSVKIEINEGKAIGTAFAKQKIIKKKGRGSRNLWVDFEMETINERTPANPHGLVVTKWTIINNDKINVINSK